MVVPIVRLVEESKYPKRLCCLCCSRTLSACHFLFFFSVFLFRACRQCLLATCQKLLLSSLIGRNTAELLTQPEAESKSKTTRCGCGTLKEPLKVVIADSQLARLHSLTSDVTTGELSHYNQRPGLCYGTSHNVLSLLQENLDTTQTTLTYLVKSAANYMCS